MGVEPLLMLPKQACYRYTTSSIWHGLEESNLCEWFWRPPFYHWTKPACGWGWESRTPTNRVKVCCATATPILNIFGVGLSLPSSVFPLCHMKGENPRSGTPDGIRTHTVRILSPLPLPIGVLERVSICISLRHIFNYTKDFNLVKILRTKNYQKVRVRTEQVFCSLHCLL